MTQFFKNIVVEVKQETITVVITFTARNEPCQHPKQSTAKTMGQLMFVTSGMGGIRSGVMED
jgi:hypothetical protein